MADWYDKALEEFQIDGYLASEVSHTDFQRVYSYLSDCGLIDYDIEKEYLYDNYVEDEEVE